MAKNPHKGNQLKTKPVAYKHPKPPHDAMRSKKHKVTKTFVPSKGY